MRKKPDGVSQFIHMKCCLIFGTKLNELLDHDMKNIIFKSKESEIEVGEIKIPSKGLFVLYIDNASEKIYLKSSTINMD